MTLSNNQTSLAAIALSILLLLVSPVRASEVSNVSPQEAQQLLNTQPDIKVLDIRTPREFRSGRISGAANINFYSRSFANNLAKLDRDATYLVYCKRGVRSGASLRAFRALGFKKVLHLPAGMNGWRRANLPIVR